MKSPELRYHVELSVWFENLLFQTAIVSPGDKIEHLIL